MISFFLVVGILEAIFVGVNIGGASAGVAWGPSVALRLSYVYFYVGFGGG